MFKTMILVFLFLLGFSGVYSANVDILSEVYNSETYFTYTFSFDDSENYNSFSFEKPKNSIIEYARDKFNNSLFYSVAGDYFIFKPIEISNNTFIIKIKSEDVSNQIIEKNAYSVYVNFNFPVHKLSFKLDFKDKFSTIDEIFPRGYSVFGENKILWILNDVPKDTFFLVNFHSLDNSNNEIVKSSFLNKYLILIIGFVIIFLIMLVYFYKKIFNNIKLIGAENINLKKKIKFNLSKKKLDDSKDLKNEDVLFDVRKDDVSKEIYKETFDDFISKYLTSNETDVLLVVKDHEALTQNEILSFIPNMTKSNLSKIITKLDGRKILKRIRVGKVSKIYLGEKIKEFEN